LSVADLFAGSGALGFEALSRGAEQCLFVEQDAEALKAIRANVTALDARARCDVRAGSVLSLAPARQSHDLILLDPPYGTGAGQVALDRLQRLGWIGAGTWMALETGADEDVAIKGLTLDAERKVGKAKLSLLRLAD
jgi:16S rRNA (guanine966-N2)-methyltransferase